MFDPSKIHTGETFFTDHQIQKSCKEIVITCNSTFAGTEKISITKVGEGTNEDNFNKIPLKAIKEVAHAVTGFAPSKTTGSRICVPLSVIGNLELNDKVYLSVSMEGLDADKTYTLELLESEIVAMGMTKWDRKNVIASEDVGSLKFAVGEMNALALPTSNITGIRLFYPNGKVTEHSTNMIKLIMERKNDLVEVGNIAGTNLTAIDAVFDDLADARAGVNTLKTEVEARLDALEANTMNKHGYNEYFVVDVTFASHAEVFTNGTAYTFYAVKMK